MRAPNLQVQFSSFHNRINKSEIGRLTPAQAMAMMLLVNAEIQEVFYSEREISLQEIMLMDITPEKFNAYWANRAEFLQRQQVESK